MGDQIALSLLENSHAFLREAASYALSAQSDARKWQFAVLDLVQSLELSLKSLLHDIHPILIYENVDNPKNTVSARIAIARLSSKLIGKVLYSPEELRRIENAIRLRNEMIHSEFVLHPEAATAKFFEVFAFVVYFQAKHLNTEIDSIISRDSLHQLLAVGKGLKELSDKAQLRMKDEEIDTDLVLPCPICGNDSFVIQDDINTCYTCRHTDEIEECGHCGYFFFAWQMEKFSIETTPVVHDLASMFPYKSACFECLPEIKQVIAEKELEERYREDEYWEMQRQYWDDGYRE